MMGVEWPFPGKGIFQRTFFVSLHSEGGLARGAVPLASGPRHWVQFASSLTPVHSGPPVPAKIGAARRAQLQIAVRRNPMNMSLPCDRSRIEPRMIRQNVA